MIKKLTNIQEDNSFLSHIGNSLILTILGQLLPILRFGYYWIFCLPCRVLSFSGVLIFVTGITKFGIACNIRHLQTWHVWHLACNRYRARMHTERRDKMNTEQIIKADTPKNKERRIIKMAHPNVKRYWSKTLKRWVTIPDDEGRE